MAPVTAMDEVVAELRRADKLLLTTHENPDGDALGSLLATHEILQLLGKDVVMLLSADEWPLPREYQPMPFGAAVHALPADATERVLVFLDCGNIERMPKGLSALDCADIVNIDHHHDNTHFGTANLVLPQASCTAEIVWGLMQELGVELTPSIAEALYIGLVTDTGRFMYANTTARSHRMAAELIEAGIDVAGLYRQLYENLPFNRLELLGRALERLSRRAGGALCACYLTRADYTDTGSAETDSDGIVDHLRAVEGTRVAMLVRELLHTDRRGSRKVSLRAADEAVDVSIIARAHGGGGHRQAAGFSTELGVEQLVDQLEAEVIEQL